MRKNSCPVGPILYGVAGRTPGSASYNYSKAMRAFGESGAVWDEATLDTFRALKTLASGKISSPI